MSRSLHEVVDALARAGILVDGPAPAELPAITGLTADARRLERGMLFCAVRGAVKDGHDFVADAAGRGAAAALVEARQPVAIPQILVRNGRRAAAVAAEAWYDRPASRLQLIGVTGTNGKTTSVILARHVLGWDRAALLTHGREIAPPSFVTQFDEFVARHRHLEDEGITIVPETNDDMIGSYAMVDPAGRFYDNVDGKYTYSEPILEVGVERALEQVRIVGRVVLDSAEIMERAGDPTATTVIDWFHMVRGEGRDTMFEDLRALRAEQIAIVHLDDVPYTKPFPEMTDGDRVYPGDGDIPVDALFDVLREEAMLLVAIVKDLEFVFLQSIEKSLSDISIWTRKGEREVVPRWKFKRYETDFLCELRPREVSNVEDELWILHD